MSPFSPSPFSPGTNNNDADLIDSGIPLGVAGGGVLDTNWQNYAAYGQVLYHDPATDVGAMYFLSRFGQPYPTNTIFDALYGEGGDAPHRSSPNKIGRILQTIHYMAAPLPLVA